MAVSSAIGAAVIAAGATTYASHEQQVTATKARRSAEDIARMNREKADKIALPNTTATSANIQASEQRAATAGGTILSNPNVGDAINTPRKTLLGS